MYTHERALELAKEHGFTLDERNRITNPGKFSGEHIRTLYYYFDCFMEGDNGDARTELEDAYVYRVTDEEKAVLGPDAKEVILTFYDSGFVTTRVLRS